MVRAGGGEQAGGRTVGPEHGFGVHCGCVGHAEVALKAWVLWDGLGRGSKKQILEGLDHFIDPSLSMP